LNLLLIVISKEPITLVVVSMHICKVLFGSTKSKVVSSLLFVGTFVVLMALAFPARAADEAFTWQLPTRNVDGTTIPATGTGALVRTTMEFGTCSAPNTFGILIGSQSFPAPATSGTMTGLPHAQTLCFRGTSENNLGERSMYSNVVTRTTPNPIPEPPVISSTVPIVWSYDVDGYDRTMRMVGTAPIGTVCGKEIIPEANVYRIDRTAVTFNRSLRGGVPVTICG